MRVKPSLAQAGNLVRLRSEADRTERQQKRRAQISAVRRRLAFSRPQSFIAFSLQGIAVFDYVE
jgi:hypothetical protein